MMKRLITKRLFSMLIFTLTIFFMASLAHSQKAIFQGYEVKEGEILITLKLTADPTRINTIAKAVGAQVIRSPQSAKVKDRRSVLVPNLYLIKVDQAMFKQSLSTLAKNPDVEYAEPNYKLSHMGDPGRIPNDLSFSDQWNLYNTGQTYGKPGADISAPQAWNKQTGSRSVVVATVDTGVDYTHPDLAGNMWVNQGEIPGNGIDDDGNGIIDDVHGMNAIPWDATGDPMDDNGHGTHVAGIIGACGNNDLGVSGVNWKVSIMSTKFLDSDGWGYTYDAYLCIWYIWYQKVIAGVNIVAVNNSWGGGGYSRILYDGIKYLQDEGILFIAAAGNEYGDNDVYPAYPANYDLMNIISVAATTHRDELAWFSNYGARTVDVAAPGDGIFSTVPDDAYETWSGTSMSTPHVTGLAALLKAQDQTRSWKEIRNLILSSGAPLTSLKNKTVTGMRIDANRALTAPSDARLLAILNPVDLAVADRSYSINNPIDLEVHNILRDKPVGTSVICTIGKTQVKLLDDGVFPDKVEKDGVFSARWTPSQIGDFTLVFKSGTMSKSINIKVGPLLKYEIAETGYTFDDISISPSSTRLHSEDESLRKIFTPFPLKMYGLEYNSLYVSDNGCASVDGTFPGWLNLPLPISAYTWFPYNNIIAPSWDDLEPNPDQDIYWDLMGTFPARRFIVQWNNLPHYDLWPSTDGVTFQVIFHEDSPDIEYAYKDVLFGDTYYDKGKSATIGIQASQWGSSTEYSYNTSSLDNEFSLGLTPTDLAEPLLIVEPNYLLDFGYVLLGQSKEQPVYLYNKGTISLEVNDITLITYGFTDFKIVYFINEKNKKQYPPLSSLTISPGKYAKVMIRYTPTIDGVYDGPFGAWADLDVSSTAGERWISIFGWSEVASDINVTTKKVTFGNVAAGESSTRNLNIQNKGIAHLVISGIDIDAPFSVDDALPITIAPNGSASLTIRFSPEAKGSFSYTMAILSNDPDEYAVLVTLSGTGTPPPIGAKLRVISI